MADARPLRLIAVPMPRYNEREGVHDIGGIPVAYALNRCYRIWQRHVTPHRGCMLR